MYVFYLLGLYIISVAINPANTVLYPPSFIYQPNKDDVFQVMEALMLRCVATGNPPPTYTWYKYDKPFNMYINVGRYTKWPNEGTLILAKPSDDDDGIYQCNATNSRGTALSVKSNIRRAEMQDFKNTEPEVYNVNEGQSASLKCQVPVSYPMPIVAWQRTKYGIPELLKESSKYVMDIDGNLYITYVTMDDDKAKYSCTAFNTRMRISKIDRPYILSVTPSQAKTSVSMLFRTLLSIKGRIGETVTLRCILSGNPPPTYQWKQRSTGISVLERPNFRTDAGGAILIIDPMTSLDADTYQCFGENTGSIKPIVIEFTVEAEMAPKLTLKLSDLNLPINGSCQLTCSATGIPEPIITWTVNGQGLEKYINGINKRIVKNTIVLTNLQTLDSAVFQCNASNSIGYDYSNGYVNVIQDKPEFIVGPQTTIIMAEKMTVTINCQAFSAPKAIVTWLKDNFPINGGRYMIQDNGDLLISNLITADSGNYTCSATNMYGTINGSSLLYVRQRTELMIRPINTWVYYGQEVKFVCTGKTDRLETQNLRIVWYKDGSEIMLADNGRININLQDNSLIISGAQTTDVGTYTCNATNGLDFDVAYASLIVQGKPHTPNSISADCSSQSNQQKALVSWNPGADNYAPIISYIVEYSTQYDRKGWYEVETETSSQSNADTVVVYVLMKPNVYYQFRVRAMNRVGTSEPSDNTMNICYLPPDIPYSNPTELFIYGTMKDNLVIQWTPMTYVEHNAAKLSYEISITCITCKSIPKDKTNTTTVSDWDQNILIYNNFQLGPTTFDMESYQLFKGTIRAINDRGFSKAKLTTAYGYSGDASPSIGPSQLILTAGVPTTSGMVPLSWVVLAKADVPTLVNGFFRGYRIEWCLASLSDADCDASTQYQDVILQSRNIPVLFGNKRKRRSTDEDLDEELNEGSKYDENYRHPTPKNPGTPLNFQILQRRKRAVLSEKTEWNYGENLTVQLKMIPGYTVIKIWLRILNSIYASARSDPPITLTTFEDIPGPVIDFKVAILGINHVTLQWQSPVETNGIIQGYRLAWREIIGLELGYMTTYPDITDPNILQFQMSGLRSQSNYRIFIWALTKPGSGVESFIDIQTQPANIAPNSPKFTVNNVVNNTVNVTFAASDTGVKGSVFYAQYRKIGQYRWDESEPQYIRTWIFIDNLANDTTYEIRIVATNGAGMATPSVTATFHTFGKLDPTRPVNNNAIWIIMVVLILILLILLAVFILWYREKTMEKLMGPTTNNSKNFSQPKIYDSIKQPLFPPSQLSTSLLSDPIDTNMKVQSPVNQEGGSLIDSYINESPEALIDDQDELPPVSFNQKPRHKKHKSRKQRQLREDSEEENDDAII